MLLVTFIMLVYKQKKYAFSKIEWLWFSQGFKFTSLYIHVHIMSRNLGSYYHMTSIEQNGIL